MYKKNLGSHSLTPLIIYSLHAKSDNANPEQCFFSLTINLELLRYLRREQDDLYPANGEVGIRDEEITKHIS